MNRANIIFDSYNMAVEEGYDRFFQQSSNDVILKGGEGIIEKYLSEELKKWENAPIRELGNITPVEYFGSFKSLDDIIKLFTDAAQKCDRYVPDALVEKLKTFGGEALDKLLELAGSKNEHMDLDELCVPLMAIRILGDMKNIGAIHPLLDMLHKSSKNEEAICEEIVDALVNIGQASIAPIINDISEKDIIEDAEEYLLGAIVRLGKVFKSEELFRCLKNTFLRMENKIIGAMCLGDYGDGRAIPTLRGFVEKNKGKIDIEVLNEIMAAIVRLGGTVDDLQC